MHICQSMNGLKLVCVTKSYSSLCRSRYNSSYSADSSAIQSGSITSPSYPVSFTLIKTAKEGLRCHDVRSRYNCRQTRRYASVSGTNGEQVNNSNNKNNSDGSESGNEEEHDPKLVSLLHSYPDQPNSPYGVLGFKDQHNFKPKELRSRYYQLAKIYHPDTKYYEGLHLKPVVKGNFISKAFNSNANLKRQASNDRDNNDKTAESSVLTSDIKNNRFKIILAAYNLLKHPLNKKNYDTYGIGWESSSPGNLYTQNTQPHPNANHRMNSNYNYSYTGNWEDYQNLHNRKQNQSYGWQDANTNWHDYHSTGSDDIMDQFYSNRRTIFLSVFIFSLAYMALQAAHIFLYDDYIGGVYNESLTASLKMNEKSESDLRDAYANFGFGDSKDERINRFLWFRKLGSILYLGDVSKIIEFLEGEKRNKGTQSEYLNEEGKLVEYKREEP